MPRLYRTPLPDDHPMIERERELIGRVTQAMETAREGRDGAYERMFDAIYNAADRAGAGRSGNP